VHRGQLNGRPYESKGKIRKIERPTLLEHDHWSAVSGLPDREENYQIVRYELRKMGDGTHLTLTEENIPDEQKRKLSEQTWQKVLQTLKEVVEGKPAP
jgi:hypothetical protein